MHTVVPLLWHGHSLFSGPCAMRGISSWLTWGVLPSQLKSLNRVVCYFSGSKYWTKSTKAKDLVHPRTQYSESSVKLACFKRIWNRKKYFLMQTDEYWLIWLMCSLVLCCYVYWKNEVAMIVILHFKIMRILVFCLALYPCFHFLLENSNKIRSLRSLVGYNILFS